MKTRITNAWRIMGALMVLAWITPAPAEEDHDISAMDATAAIDTVRSYVRARGPSQDEIKLFDMNEGKDIRLELQGIHTGETRRLGEEKFAVCTDFISSDGRSYMLWFVVKKGVTSKQIISGYLQNVDAPNKMVVEDILIHKVDGQARIKWVENDDGTWVAHHVEPSAKK